MNKKLILAILILLPGAAFAFAIDAADFSAFKYYKTIFPQISVPTVIEVPFTQDFFALPVFAVHNTSTGIIEPSAFLQNKVETKSHVQVTGQRDLPIILQTTITVHT